MIEMEKLTTYIKAEALRLGFDVCGIAKASPVDSPAIEYCNRWLGDGKHGTMGYLERNLDKRYDPTVLVEGCRSIIAVAMNYAPSQTVKGISDYAQGNDYHKAVKDRLFRLLEKINETTPCKGRAFCDSAPILERYWAVIAGLGWVGRNHQLIIPGKGSRFFLGELLVDIELEYDKPYTANHCGNCTKCIGKCPTGALCEDSFDARKCLSYLTIEHHGELPENIGKKMGNSFYGCDRCLEACPHNRFSTPNIIPELQPSSTLLEMRESDWHNLTEEKYRELFKGSAIERCGYEKLVRNIKAASEE